MSNRQGAGEHIGTMMHIIYPDVYANGSERYAITFCATISDDIMTISNVDVYVDICKESPYWDDVHSIYADLGRLSAYFDQSGENLFLSDRLSAISGLYDLWLDSVSVEEV